MMTTNIKLVLVMLAVLVLLLPLGSSLKLPDEKHSQALKKLKERIESHLNQHDQHATEMNDAIMRLALEETAGEEDPLPQPDIGEADPDTNPEDVPEEETQAEEVPGDDVPDEQLPQNPTPVNTPLPLTRSEASMGAPIFESLYFSQMKPNWQWKNWEQEDVLMAFSTDKPVYRPGDELLSRVYFFNHTTKEPASCAPFSPSLTLRNSNDDIVLEYNPQYFAPCSGTSRVFGFKIPESTKGGVYYLTASYYSLPPSTVKIRIRSYQQNILASIDYSKQSYNPGEEVTAKLSIKSDEQDPGFENSSFDVSVSSGDERKGVNIGSDGTGTFKFNIPSTWTKDSIFISFTIKLGESETVKTDVIAVTQPQKLTIDITGQSGRIVYGLSNKIYFEVFSDDSRTQHLDVEAAEIVEITKDEETNVVLKDVKTEFFGRGIIRLTPTDGCKYYFKYLGVNYFLDIQNYNKRFDISQFTGHSKLLVSIVHPVIRNRDGLDIRIYNPDIENIFVAVLTVTQKENIIYSQRILLESEMTRVQIHATELYLPNGGVFSVNVYEPVFIIQNNVVSIYPPPVDVPVFSYQMLANNIGFMIPDRKLDVTVTTDKDVYQARDTVNYEITVVDHETQQPPSEEVMVALSVTDLTPFLELDESRQPPNLMAQVYLEKEIKPTKEYEFTNANKYLDFIYNPEECVCAGGEKESKLKLELLMGTQKWRQFMFDPTFQQYQKSQYSSGTTFDKYIYDNLILATSSSIIYEDMAPMPEAADGGIPMNGEAQANGAGEVPEGESTPDNEEIGGDDDQVERTDFTQTQLYSHYAFTAGGKYKGSFELGDLVTTFKFDANAVSFAGVYGIKSQTFRSTLEFYIEAKIPEFMTNEDVLEVPLTIHNKLSGPVNVELTAAISLGYEALTIDLSESQVTVPGGESKQVLLTIKALRLTDQDFKITLSANCAESCSASISTMTRIIGKGFPVVSSKSGFLGSGAGVFLTQATLPINVPSTYEEGSLELRAKVYTSQLDHIYEALVTLIRNPHGCFEQTSATTYPLVMALIFLKSMPEQNEEVTAMIADAEEKLQAGYNKLVTFECSEGGYEWFGACPAHEALTAYGIMQFNEMKQVMDIDQTMIGRTTEWLMSRRDGQGHFAMAANGLDSFASPPPDLSDAYILWSLTSSGVVEGLEAEISAVVLKTQGSDDNYLNALVANILYNVGRVEEAKVLATALVGAQDQATGEVLRKETSITRSQGLSLNLETTSLAALAWMKDPDSAFSANVELAVKYIVSNIQSGTFGSTQSTILSLKVLTEYLKNSQFEGKGTFELTFEEELIYSIDFDSETDTKSIDFNDALKEWLLENQSKYEDEVTHELNLVLKNFEGDQTKFRVSYLLESEYKDVSPISNSESEIDFQLTKTSFNEDQAVGEITTYNIVISNNNQNEVQGMLVAEIRVPSCQQVSFEALENLQSQNKIAYFELLNDNTDVVLYWRGLDKDETKEIEISMARAYKSDKCVVRPSKAYLYYNIEGSEVWTQ